MLERVRGGLYVSPQEGTEPFSLQGRDRRPEVAHVLGDRDALSVRLRGAVQVPSSEEDTAETVEQLRLREPMNSLSRRYQAVLQHGLCDGVVALERAEIADAVQEQRDVAIVPKGAPASERLLVVLTAA